MKLSRLYDHAKRELELIDYHENSFDEYGRMIYDSIMETVELVSGQGHSGGSLRLVVQYLTKLLEFQPLSPLEGTADEWSEPKEGISINLRCSRVMWFRNEGKYYDSEGIRFYRIDDNGEKEYFWRTPLSFVEITFPYSPYTIEKEEPK